jgi:hypothetical protein
MHIMTVIVVGVVDMTAAGVGDRQNLTNASRRRRTASIGRGMKIGVSDGIDIPVGIIAEVRTIPSEIGIVRQELLWGGTKGESWARVSLESAYVQVGVGECATYRSITAGFGEGSGKVGKSNTRVYQSGTNGSDDRAVAFVSRNPIPVSLLKNRAMWALILIVVSNSPHGTVVMRIIAAVYQRESLNRAAVRVLGNVVLFVSIISVPTVAIVD